MLRNNPNIVIMLLKNCTREKDVSLRGAVQINHSSFFVYKDNGGNTFLKTGDDEKIHKNAVLNMINSNPHITRLLKRFRIKPTIDTKTLNELTSGHMNETCNIAMGVYSFLSNDIKSEVNKETIKEASMLHDLGKVLIPSKILNKPAKLNFKERKIMNIHSTLGYELLKTAAAVCGFRHNPKSITSDNDKIPLGTNCNSAQLSAANAVIGKKANKNGSFLIKISLFPCYQAQHSNFYVELQIFFV